MAEWINAIIGLGAFAILCFNTFETYRTKRHMAKVSQDMRQLEVNTNTKMDAAIEAIRAKGVADAAVAGMEGEARGRASRSGGARRK